MNVQPHLNEQYPWYDPRRYDLSLSERIQQIIAPNTAYADEGQGSNLFGEGARTPAAVSSVNNISGDPQREWRTADGTVTGYGQTGYNEATSSPTTGENISNFSIGGSTGGGGTNIPTTPDPTSTFQDLLSRVRDEARRVAGAGYDRARGIYDEGKNLLNQRRGEFQNIFNQGKEDILGGFETGRGQLQQSAQGNQTRMANALRAMGLGGSAYVNSAGRQAQDQARGLGSLINERQANERENLSGFNENQTWANTQEAALQRSLEDAGNLRSSAESSADTNFLSGIGNLFNTLLSNQQALQASVGSKVANPFTASISDMTNKLNSTLPNLEGGDGTVQSANIREQDPTLALLKRRQGVAGAGLYA